MGCSPSKIVVNFESRNPYEEVRFLEMERRHLDKYFHHLSAKLRSQNPHAESHILREAGELGVQIILKAVADVDKRFKLAPNGLRKVGSCYGLDIPIAGARRLDFIAVLADLTQDTVSLDVTNIRNGYLPVKVNVNRNVEKQHRLSDRWKTMINGETIIGCCSETKTKPGLLDKFVKRLQTVCNSYGSRKAKFGTFTVDKEFAARKHGSCVVMKFIVTLDPNDGFKVRFDDDNLSRVMYVTVTPAIKWNDVAGYIYPEDFHFPKLYDAVLEDDTFLVVPCPDGNFKVAFTETETSLVRNMSRRHRLALGVLKFLIKRDKSFYEHKHVSKYSLFDSYSINMIMLALEETCPCRTSSPPEYEFYECVIHVMKIVQASLHNHSMLYSDGWDQQFDDNVNDQYGTEMEDSYREEECVALNDDGRDVEPPETVGDYDSVREPGPSTGDLEDAGIVDNTTDVNQEENRPNNGKENEDDIPEETGSCNATCDPSYDNEDTENELSRQKRGPSVTKDNHSKAQADESESVGQSIDGRHLPLEYDVLRLLSPNMRAKLTETSLYVNCTNFCELMKHDLKYWIGQRQRYDLDRAGRPNYGVTCLEDKIMKNTDFSP